jgi:hypothetical protein
LAELLLAEKLRQELTWMRLNVLEEINDGDSS